MKTRLPASAIFMDGHAIKVTTHTTYKFRRYLSTDDLCLLCNLCYSDSTFVLSFIMDGNHLEQLIFFQKTCFCSGKKPVKLNIYFGTNGVVFDFPEAGIFITFQLNSLVRFTTSQTTHIVNHLTCRFYN